MKTILAIEIKDTKTIATLTNIVNGKGYLVFHKSYNSRPVLSERVLYDGLTAKDIQKDISNIIPIKQIDKTYLTINTKRTAIETFKTEFAYNTDVKAKLQQIKNAKAKPEWYVLNIQHTDVENILTKREVYVTMEFVHREYLDYIVNQFKMNGINFDKVIPVSAAITNVLDLNSKKDELLFNIVVEEGFTLVNVFKNGYIYKSTKWNYGLFDIYVYISQMIDENQEVAKLLFNKFGSIPPEDVVDNKKIHTTKTKDGTKIYTKKDLSVWITENVNSLFSNIKKTYQSAIAGQKKSKLTFSGEITSLSGFKKYARKSFVQENIQTLKSDFIGLEDENEFITSGIIIEAIKKNSKELTKEVDNLINKQNLLNKIRRIYSYI